MKTFRFGLATLIAAGAFASASAQLTISDGNSSADLDPTTSAGMRNWVVDGTDHLFQQWFWYRIGGNGGEAAINTIGGTSASASGNVAQISYQNGLIKVETTYIMTGGSNSAFVRDDPHAFLKHQAD